MIVGGQTDIRKMMYIDLGGKPENPLMYETRDITFFPS
jgi:hypothetical protein